MSKKPINSLCTLKSLLRLQVVISLGLLTGGCGFFGAFYGLFIDPLVPAPTIAAEHEMKDQRLLIWVEDLSMSEQNPLLRRELTQQLRKELLDHQAAADVVDYDRIARFRNLNPDFPQWSMTRIGQHFQVEQILQLTIKNFQLHHEAGEGYYRTALTIFASVIEVESQKRLWPEDQAARPIDDAGKFTQGQGIAFENRLIRQQCQSVAQQLAPAFYKHKQPKGH